MNFFQFSRPELKTMLAFPFCGYFGRVFVPCEVFFCIAVFIMLMSMMVMLDMMNGHHIQNSIDRNDGSNRFDPVASPRHFNLAFTSCKRHCNHTDDKYNAYRGRNSIGAFLFPFFHQSFGLNLRLRQIFLTIDCETRRIGDINLLTVVFELAGEKRKVFLGKI